MWLLLSRMTGLALVVCAISSVWGCEAAPQRATPVSIGSTSAEGGTWPFWPERVQVHPLSRLVVDEHGALQMIEARVEFLDPDDLTTRASGQLRIDLHDADGMLGAGPVLSWNTDLRDAETNRRHYDEVTRTYLCRLELDATDLPKTPELRIYFLSADDRPLNTATLLLRTE